MKRAIVQSVGPVLLVGGGECSDDVLTTLLEDGSLPAVAADSGAARLLAHGRQPDAVIGDMDSLPADRVAALAPGVVHRIAEQDSTDFDKCLRNVASPLVLACGFLGRRLDHQLAALTVLARRPDRRCLLIGAQDVALLCPPALSLPLASGTRVSLWPLGPVEGRSDGLRWPIDGLGFAPDGVVGTSNEATGPVRLQMDAPRMMLILPADCLAAVRAALDAAPARWPARAG
jgi:thiamine pyrophosphokinase